VTNEQWQRVKTVFQAAVERPPAERPAFLAAAAADDEAVRREVESLLAADAADVSVFDRLPVAGSAATANEATPFAADDRQFAAGQHLGHYQIVEAIGAGGMGVVYRAKDTTLGRDVALKSLPTFLTSDSDRVARFRREAQVLASLNHPRIAQIHGFEQANGAQFLVLERRCCVNDSHQAW
jgi:hypothetical protein